MSIFCSPGPVAVVLVGVHPGTMLDFANFFHCIQIVGSNFLLIPPVGSPSAIFWGEGIER